MKVQQIGYTSFEAKQRFVSNEAKKNIKFLLDKMSEGTSYNSDGTCFKTTIFKTVATKDGKIKFQDGRMYLGDRFEVSEMKNKSLFTVGKTELVIDNNGEIIQYYKPFFTTWNSIIKKLDKYLAFFRENFDNEELVEHRKLSMAGFTEKGYEKFLRLTEGKNG